MHSLSLLLLGPHFVVDSERLLCVIYLLLFDGAFRTQRWLVDYVMWLVCPQCHIEQADSGTTSQQIPHHCHVYICLAVDTY